MDTTTATAVETSAPSTPQQGGDFTAPGLNTAATSADQATAAPTPSQPIAELPELDLTDKGVAGEHQAYMDVPPEGKLYEFEYGTGEIKSGFVNEMQTLARDMALPGWMAKFISKKYVAAEQAYKAGRLTPQSIELSRAQAEYQLRGIWKGEGEYESNVRAAQSVLHALPADKQERVRGILIDSNLGNDPLVISHFAALARHRAAAKKGK